MESIGQITRSFIHVILMIIASSASVEASIPKMDDFLEKLALRERTLQNLMVIGDAWDEKSNASGVGNWERSKTGMSVTAWYDGMAGSAARVDVRHQVHPWVHGAAPFNESSFTLAFDGQVGKRINYTGGPLGKSIKVMAGMLYPTMPDDLPMLGYASGTLFSIYFVGPHTSMSQCLRTELQEWHRTRPDAPITINEEKFEGTDAIRIAFGSPEKGQQVWWFDSQRGLSLLNFRQWQLLQDGRACCYIEIRVAQLEEVAPNLWYPLEAYRYEGWYPSAADRYVGPPRASNQPRVRKCYKASKVVANDPVFDKAVFSPAFPAN